MRNTAFQWTCGLYKYQSRTISSAACCSDEHPRKGIPSQLVTPSHSQRKIHFFPAHPVPQPVSTSATIPSVESTNAPSAFLLPNVGRPSRRRKPVKQQLWNGPGGRKPDTDLPSVSEIRATADALRFRPELAYTNGAPTAQGKGRREQPSERSGGAAGRSLVFVL